MSETIAAPTPIYTATLPGLLRSEPALAATGLFLLFLMLPTGVAALLDSRTIAGIDIWDKPLKFQFALSVYALTLSLFAHWLPAGFTSSRGYRLYRASVIAAILGEMAWLMGAAALGVASHFNTTELGTLIYRTMGGLAIWLTSITMVYAVVIARRGRDFGNPALKHGIVLGLGLVLPLTLITAGFMSGWGSHHMGGSASDAGGLWPMGWSRDGGDLRVAHFFATHALHFVPALALVSTTVFGRNALWPVRAGALLFVGFVAYCFVQALFGQPFLGFIG